MEKYKILLAEDDPNFGHVLKTYLSAKGFLVTLCSDGEIAYKTFTKDSFNLLLLDIMMPQKDGFEVAKKIREINPNIPVIFLTAKSLQTDILQGFKLGADDYITKPFTMNELLARVNAVINRAYKHNYKTTRGSIINIGDFEFDYGRQTLKYKDSEQKLTSRESELLKLLCNYSNQNLERHIALQLIWGEQSYFHVRNMDVYITRLRKYLKKDPRVELLNIRGYGFKLILPE